MTRIAAWFVAAAILIVLFAVAQKSEEPTAPNNNDGTATQAVTLRDVHGLAVDVVDSNKVWIANHSGLYLLKYDKELSAVGTKRDDYMGFSPHPTDANTFFTSGHPANGGNIGFQKSTDAGQTWQKISDGLNGPVDFHAMAIGQVDPNIVYGVYRGQLQKSTDGGASWQITGSAPSIIALATSPKDKDTVYAATQIGLLQSIDQATTWSTTGLSGVVLALAINPTNPNEMFASSQSQGLVRSADGGQSWEGLSASAPQSVRFIAIDKNNPKILYVVAQNLGLHKTTDSGASWRKVR